MIDFASVPPEITSARMYAGPGSASLMAAASAWDVLAAELASAALDYAQAVTALTSEEWLGPASVSMAEKVAPYVAWLGATATRAEGAATQARAAAAAFETAFSAVVPPPAIAANRAEATRLTSTNALGQNAGAIAALESEYGEMWARDAVAMYGYAGSSASASSVTAFAPAAGTPGSPGPNPLSRVIGQITGQLRGLAAPLSAPLHSEWNYLASSSGPLSWLWQTVFGTQSFPTGMQSLLTAYTPYASFLYNTEGLPYFSIGMGNSFVQIAKSLGAVAGPAPAAAGGSAKATPGLGGLGGLLGGAAPVTARLGDATAVGRLSVPPAWHDAAPAPGPAAAPLPVSNIREAPDPAAGHLFGGLPLAGPGAGTPGSGPRYGFRPTVMARPPFAG